MLVLDTNVVTELMRANPDLLVARWLNEQRSSALFLTTISVGEISLGIQILPPGKRRRFLEQGFEEVLAAAFAGRILPFDETAARRYAEVMAERRRLGRPVSSFDGQIAAIALSLGFAIVTRNVRDFVDCGLDVINPFEPA